MFKTKEHRGTDIGTALGTHLHIGTSGPSVGDVGVWNGTDWIGMSPRTATLMPTAIDAVKSWANKIATDDNDMIQLRKKNGILYVMKVVPHRSNKWEKLDPKDVAVITDVPGAKLEDVDLATLRDELVLRVEPEEAKPVPHMELGWYQDSKADLFYYEGEGHWREVDLKTNKKLTESVVTGTLEFIG
jgi:hypothetical protein